jgi:hypothetical protein
MTGMENKMAIRLACDVQAGAVAYVSESRPARAAGRGGLVAASGRG